MTDAIVGWISNNKLCEKPDVLVYARSLAECGFKGDKIIFTCEMPHDFQKLLESLGFIVSFQNRKALEVLYRDRHLAYYKWNLDHNYRYIISSDTRDVVFQRNPIEFLENYASRSPTSEFLFLIAEGFTHKLSPINTSNQRHFQSALIGHQQDFENWDVLNGGIAAGTAVRMSHFDLLIWTSGNTVRDGDQCATNYMYRIMQYDPTIHVLYPDKDAFCLTGEGMNLSPDKIKTACKDGKVINQQTKEPYFMFHQWDRTTYADAIRKQWGKK